MTAVIRTRDVSVPEGSLPSYILQKIAEANYGVKVALVDGPSDKSITYSQLPILIRNAAAGFARSGIKQGDVVAIMSPNNPYYAIAFHALASIGVIITTINPVYTADEVAHQLKDSGATNVVTVGLFLEKTQEVATKGVQVKQIFQFDAESDGKAGDIPVVAFQSLLEGGDEGYPDVTVNGSDILVIPYSSGTSGLPKGVELTHSNVLANIIQLSSDPDQISFPEDTVLIGVLPFFHIYGMVVILNLGLVFGAKTVTMPKFDPGMFLKLLKVHQVTVAHVAPPLINFMAKHPAVESVLPLPALTELFSGAAPLGPELVDAAKARLGVKYVRQGYGMTEMSPASHITPYSVQKPGSIGTLVPGMECKIISTETGEVVNIGEEGEICCKGPNIMKGYLNNPDATASTIDAEGFLHTGDVGYMDEDKQFFIVDRVKELIKVKGFQVAPAELEAVISGFDKVADVAVIGIADDRAGELPKAFVVKQATAADLTEQEVKDFVEPKVAPYKKLAQVEFVDSIPKSAAGKILRKVLRAQEKAKAEK